MNEKRKKNLNLGVLLMILYSCVIGAVLCIFIPDATIWAEHMMQNSGPLIIFAIIALFLIAFLVCWPLTFLSKMFLKSPNKPLAITCGLITGLPVTTGLIVNAAQELYSGGFTMGCYVLAGGLFPILLAYQCVVNPKNIYGLK